MKQRITKKLVLNRWNELRTELTKQQSIERIGIMLLNYYNIEYL